MNREGWGSYWTEQKTPLHADDSTTFYEKLGREISFNLGQLSNKKVLEIGCGDGSIYPFLEISPNNYTGVDFSKALLNKFSKKEPSLDLIESDAIDYMKTCNQKYDIIFSFGVLQYLDISELNTFFHLQKAILNEGGVCCHFGVPVKELSSIFFMGLGANTSLEKYRPRSIFKNIKSRLSNKIGNWHSIKDLYDISAKCGYRSQVFSNMNYFYRVNLYQEYIKKC